MTLPRKSTVKNAQTPDAPQAAPAALASPPAPRKWCLEWSIFDDFNSDLADGFAAGQDAGIFDSPQAAIDAAGRVAPAVKLLADQAGGGVVELRIRECPAGAEMGITHVRRLAAERHAKNLARAKANGWTIAD